MVDDLKEIKINKRYLLFGFPAYYPAGGFLDFLKNEYTVEELLDFVRDEKDTNLWYHIFDMEEGKIIKIKGKSFDFKYKDIK